MKCVDSVKEREVDICGCFGAHSHMLSALSVSTHFNIDGVFWGRVVPKIEKEEVEETSGTRLCTRYYIPSHRRTDEK